MHEVISDPHTMRGGVDRGKSVFVSGLSDLYIYGGIKIRG